MSRPAEPDDPSVNVHGWVAAGAGEGEPAAQVHETPGATVFVFEHRALKLKKAVDFGFLDFSTLEKREGAIRREFAFNRETTPDVYRAIHAVTRETDGALALDGSGAVVEWVLEMRPFATGAVLSDDPERLDGALAEALGRDLAGFHARSAPLPEAGGASTLAYVIGSNAERLRSLGAAVDQVAVERLTDLTRAEFGRLAPLMDERRDGGWVRRCHGDLHLGNVVVEGGRALLFDCIEFSDRLSQIDVLYDAAFLTMDLDFRGCKGAANRVLNAWLDEAARGFGAELWSGLAALPLFQSVRAGVRAHVSGHGGDAALGSAYLEVAEHYLAPAEARLVGVGGLSGSGKTTFARQLAPELGSAPGAVVLRSDEIRKRHWNCRPLDRARAEAYTEQASERVYTVMLELAEACLAAGRSVVLDAVFLQPDTRSGAEALAHRLGLEFQGFWLAPDPDLLRNRLRRRRNDASDADETVLERQLATDAGSFSRAWRLRPEEARDA